MDAADELKRARGGGGKQSVDQLSALPDDLLHAVLSRLKARQVVRTCVLSTRWRHLWRSVSCLRIDQREFATASDGFLLERQRFKNFAHIVLRRHDAAFLEEFRLHVGFGCDFLSRYAESWVRHGISQDETWPCRLKRLHVNNVCLDSYFARHINSRCPALEDMRLKNCSFLLTEDIRFTSASLKKVVIIGFRVLENNPFGLILEAPALASLRLTGHHPHICDNDLIEMQLSLLDELFNVMSLHLSRFGVMFLVLGDDPGLYFPKFKNLKTLSLEDCDISDDFLTLKHFLRNSPNLEKLMLPCCKLFNPRPKRYTKEIMGKAHSYSQDTAIVECKNLRLTEIIYPNIEPMKVEEALEDPDWVNAMHEELHNFERNLVWTSVENPDDNHNVTGTKWVFRNKQDEDGQGLPNKARLLAQGYTQVEA
ncbi:MEIOTIC F-BOX protein MOF-like [Aegilops tauschii subsp. strangulata]|uniref:MEIOTIC F-BOX protein MOF-like n=1 Tax=Aegilops tauschii subsp. strangulata TaxID=200361 RepID=UPI00098AAE54|nr:MEIOTIC F-BOX protein MOF-like [Aegilops tauschii subsp. strangulata]